jgi:transcriptional regulatory protein LevR
VSATKQQQQQLQQQQQQNKQTKNKTKQKTIVNSYVGAGRATHLSALIQDILNKTVHIDL